MIPEFEAQIRQRAKEVAADLFLANNGMQAERLSWQLGDRVLFGWSRESVELRIVKAMLWAAHRAEGEK